MDKSRVYQSEKEFSCGNGIARLNIFNGRLLYNYPITSIGSGSYQIDVSLVYNSQFKLTDFGNKMLGFRNGWKYSFEQYLFPYLSIYDIDGFTTDDYVYIDENWCIHRFIKYRHNNDNGWVVYYDESGTGLKLVVNINNETEEYISQEISDEYGNKYNFENERLSSFVSAINPLIKKRIEYDNYNKVLSIYDTRKQSRKILFQYNEEGLPIKVYTTVNNINYLLEYENRLIVKLKKNNSFKTKEIHQFNYANNYLNCVINSENQVALKFEYSTNNNIEVVTRVLSGAMKKVLVTENDISEIYCGDDNYSGDDVVLTNFNQKYKGYVLSMPNKYVRSIDSFSYQTSFTEISNMKGIKIRYYFDVDGRAISDLEYSNNSNYFTLTRESGWEVNYTGNSNFYFNGNQAKVLTKSNNKYSWTINQQLFSNFKAIFNIDSDEDGIKDEAYSEHFNLSFWIMFNENNDSKYLAKLRYKLGENDIVNHFEYAIINKTLGNCWQMVSIPMNLGTIQDTLSEIEISFEADIDASVLNDNLFIADLRFNKGGSNSIFIDDSAIGNDESIELKIGDMLYYSETGENEAIISPDFYLTQNDIIATYRSLFFSRQNGLVKYDLFYCNKTKVKSVYSVSLLSRSNSNYSFTIEDHTSDGVNNPDIPNYHFRMIDLLSIDGEEKKIYMVSEIQRRFQYDNTMNKYYYETKTAIGALKDVDSKKRLPDSKATLSYVWENADGTSRACKYSKKSSPELEQHDQRITNENYYDEFGNILRTEVYEDDNDNNCNDERLITYYTYDDSKENPIKIEKDGIVVEYTYNSDGNMNNIINKYNKKFICKKDEPIQEITPVNVNKQIYEYDDFKELIKIKFYDKNSNLIYEANIKQNKESIIGLKDTSNTNYGFIYNGLSELSSVYKNKKLIQSYQKVISTNIDQIKSKTYQNNNNIYENILQYDKYGKMLSSKIKNLLNNEEDNVTFEYEETNGKKSSSLNRLVKVTDPFVGGNHLYEYDDIDISKVVYTNAKTNSKVVTNANSSKRYKVNNDPNIIKYDIINEDLMNKNPKCSYNYVVAHNNNDVSNIKDKDFNKLSYYSFDYAYDNLGRLVIKKSLDDVYTNATIRIQKEIEYYEGTQLPKIINYNVNSKLNNEDGNETNANLTYKNSYINGNITKVIEEGNRFIKNPKNAESLERVTISQKVSQYGYDSHNRLVKETKPNNDYYDYLYGQTSNMVEQVKKNGSLIKSFEYVAGKCQ